MNNVEQKYDDFPVFNEEEKTELEKLLGLKLVRIFARHDREEGPIFQLCFENGQWLSIMPTQGDFSVYINVDITTVKEDKKCDHYFAVGGGTEICIYCRKYRSEIE